MTQTAPVLHDFICPGCGKGTSRVGRECIDCVCRPTEGCRSGGCDCGECLES